jgi:endonuclease VIII
MPEGNTIHRLARLHNRDFGGRRVTVASPQGRFSREAKRLDGRKFRRAEAFGKHLFHHWGGGLVVHVHLGMAGWFYRHRAPGPEPRSTVRMRLSTKAVTTDLIGPPTCELMPEFARRALLARLGPDPLRTDFDPDRVWQELRRRPKRPIGDALLDQRVLSGVGNIYRNEALYLTGIHPLRPSGRVTPAEWDALWRTTRSLMRRGVAQAQVRTVGPREPAHPLSGRAGEDDSFYVYRAEVCRRCASPIREFPLSARRMFACETCQPRAVRQRKVVRKRTGRSRIRSEAASAPASVP